METVGEPYGFYPKLLKWKHFVPSVPKSLGQQALRKIRSLEHFPAVCPANAVNSSIIKTSPLLGISSAPPGPENRCD
jgi:hypothetical protein